GEIVHHQKRKVARLFLRLGARKGVVLRAPVVSRCRGGVGMFRGQVNPVTGRQEWVAEERDVESEDGDLSCELARSQYGDMLHDTARNQLYCQAIEKAVSDMKAKGRAAHVLDIGTGTGLLSMMAARAGAARVTAVEVMRPMVRIAREVISANGYSDTIRVVGKRSTDMTENDMEGGRANILVTEVFDTELIGEGALITYSHALQNLMEPDCIVIPDSVTVNVQLVRSEFLWRHHKLIPEALPGSVTVPADWRKCPGAPSLWDLHAEQLQIPQQMNTLSDPTHIAKFKLSDPGLSSDRSVQEVVVPVSQGGTCHGVLMWWTADMSEAELSMSPWDYTQWRDHWLQAVQLLPEPLNVKKGDQLSVNYAMMTTPLWFH
ncbi:Protein arginine N-methyltransferase 7, partial [Geodia barretti]